MVRGKERSMVGGWNVVKEERGRKWKPGMRKRGERREALGEGKELGWRKGRAGGVPGREGAKGGSGRVYQAANVCQTPPSLRDSWQPLALAPGTRGSLEAAGPRWKHLAFRLVGQWTGC